MPMADFDLTFKLTKAAFGLLLLLLMKAFMNWSGGKDSSLCLYYTQQQGIPVEALLTSVNSAHDRISMHGVRRELLRQQAAAIKLPLHTLELPEQPGMATYETILHITHHSLQQQGFTHAVYGDIFLEDLKTYRVSQLAKEGLEAVFPLWERNTKVLMQEFLALGFKAIVVCVNDQFLDQSFCGRLIDEAFMASLPANVDVCGENGEFHSFVFDGPFFTKPVLFEKGEIIYRHYAAPKEEETECFTDAKPKAGFYFCDLLPLT
ncbi:MAG: protein of unknown function ATP-binding region [Flaviaesturariibacter sp.]|nr:protein of unknown function ATP-binding region [Flaviaesturariibacter sp.]